MQGKDSNSLIPFHNNLDASLGVRIEMNNTGDEDARILGGPRDLRNLSVAPVTLGEWGLRLDSPASRTAPLPQDDKSSG